MRSVAVSLVRAVEVTYWFKLLRSGEISEDVHRFELYEYEFSERDDDAYAVNDLRGMSSRSARKAAIQKHGGGVRGSVQFRAVSWRFVYEVIPDAKVVKGSVW